MSTKPRKITDLLMFWLTCQMSLKGSRIFKLKVSWKISNHNCLGDSEKIIAPNTV